MTSGPLVLSKLCSHINHSALVRGWARRREARVLRENPVLPGAGASLAVLLLTQKGASALGCLNYTERQTLNDFEDPFGC